MISVEPWAATDSVFGVEDIIDPSSFRKPLQIAVDPYESVHYQLF
jgi:hypothetical protein